MKKLVFFCYALFLIVQTISSQNANWSAVLPNTFPTNASGQIHGLTRVSQMKFHPTLANKRYAISARGGLFISTNSGANWTVTPGTDFMAYARLASVCIDHTNDQILYLGTGDHNYYYTGSGIFKSTNGGTTFSYIGLTGKVIVDIIMDPLDNQKIIALTSTGIYKSINAGTTWVLKTTSRPFDEIKLKTPVSRTLYAASRDSAFFRSLDFGDTWTQITNGIVLPAGITNGNGCRIAVTPADTNVVYLGMVANSGTIYKSTDGGTTFNAIKNTASPYLTYYDNTSTSSGQGDYNFGIGVDRNNSNILYLVAHNNWKSTDGGATWTQLTNWWQKCHTDMHQIITNPYNNNELYNMNDGGVWLSTDGGSNWTPKSDGMNGYEVYHGNCSPTRRDMISIGTQDNGELYSNTINWFTNRGGDWGSQCAFDYRANSSMVYYYQNNKRRLVNGSDGTYGLPAQVTLLHDIAFHRSNPNLAFVADSFIYRTNNLTAATPTWTQIASLGKKIMAMHSHYSDANKLYIITSNGLIYVSTNALSATPTFVSYSLPNTTNNKANITSIKSNSNIIYATLNTKVYRSSDNGATWTNITLNLPSVNHVKIIADEFYSANEMVFVCSNNAVYYKTLTANTWTIFSTNLPTRTDAIDLSIYNDSTSNTILRYASYGRGMWETPISNLRTLTANFEASNTNPCPGTNITFSDLSTGNVVSRNWTFVGGTPSTSTLANPIVSFNGQSKYNVSLTVSNGTTNTTLTKNNYISTGGGNLPLSEGFEGLTDPPTNWSNIDNGTLNNKWAKTATVSGYGLSSNAMIYDNYSWNIVGQKDELLTSSIDLVNYNSAKLTFDIAYQVYNGYVDSLVILASTDCGVTFTRVYAKGGALLSTAGSGANNFSPTALQWRTDTINLASLLGQSSVILAFQNINGYGNKLYIDNVNIRATVPVSAGVDKTICLSDSTTIGTTLSNGLTYSWLPTNGLSSSSISNPKVSPNSNTTYIVTSTHALSGIQNKDTVIVNVNQALTPPIGLSASSITINSFILNWTSSIGANHYLLDISIDSNFNTFVSGYNSLIVAGINKTVTSLVAGNKYYVRIRAYNTCVSPNSSKFTIATLCSAPVLLATLNISALSFVCKWNNINGATSYLLDVSNNRNFSTFLPGYNSLIVNSDSALVNNLAANTKYYFRVKATNISGSSNYSNIDSIQTFNTINFTLNLFLEGLHLGNGKMTSAPYNADGTSPQNIADTITIELHDTLGMYMNIYSTIALLDTNGYCSFNVPFSLTNNNFYIAIKHRNSIETWSANPVLITNNATYNFSNSNNKAFGNNQSNLGNGVFAIYCGDINQDGSVDPADFPELDIGIVNGLNGGYYNIDLNGDLSVDPADFPLLDMNIIKGIFSIHP
jgi:photosystem II stability/assembly factor-like uncharacterized protein